MEHLFQIMRLSCWCLSTLFDTGTILKQETDPRGKTGTGDHQAFKCIGLIETWFFLRTCLTHHFALWRNLAWNYQLISGLLEILTAVIGRWMLWKMITIAVFLRCVETAFSWAVNSVRQFFALQRQLLRKDGWIFNRFSIQCLLN